MRKHRDVKLVRTEKGRNNLVSEQSYHATKLFTGNLLAIEMKKTQITMNKPVYLGLSILDLSKTVIYEFWYDYLKPKYDQNVTLCFMDTDNFIVHMKIDDIYKDIAEDVETRSDAANFEIDRPLSKGKNKKVIGLMKDELGGQIMKEFFGLRAKTYSCLKENNDENKKAKGTKKSVIRRKLKFQDYKNCLNAAKIHEKLKYLEEKKFNVDKLKEFVEHKTILETQQRFKSERHNIFTEVINKIALSKNDAKRMLSIDPTHLLLTIFGLQI